MSPACRSGGFKVLGKDNVAEQGGPATGMPEGYRTVSRSAECYHAYAQAHAHAYLRLRHMLDRAEAERREQLKVQKGTIDNRGNG